jgi:uncharacterized RDD family membrane protein YckC
MSSLDSVQAEPVEYGGFWIRVGAALIDSLLILLVIGPLLTLIYGRQYWLGAVGSTGYWDILFNYVLPAAAIVAFWIYKSATPGKMVLGLVIVDADTGQKPSTAQYIGRYLAYYVATLPLLLGIIWVGIDKRKQGWHDKLARTVVIRTRRSYASLTNPASTSPQR